MYKRRITYGYTKEQEKLIGLQKELERLKGIKPINGIQKVGLWLSIVGVGYQIKGLLLKMKRNINE
jgi:hypothetical protein